MHRETPFGRRVLQAEFSLLCIPQEGIYEEKADTAYVCDVCSHKGDPLSFKSDDGLARHKRGAAYRHQHQVVLAMRRIRARAAADSSAAHASLLPAHLEHGQGSARLQVDASGMLSQV